MPTAKLASAAAALGHAHVELDTDGVARGLYLYNGLGRHLWPSLSAAATKTAKREVRSHGAAPFVNVRDGYHAVPLAGGAGTLPTHSYVRVLNEPTNPELFDGKTVFVGATAAGFGDILPTPFSGLSRPMSGVEFHANAYSALGQELMIKPTPRWVGPGLALATILLLAITLPRMRPTRTLLACLFTLAAVVALFLLGLFTARVWLPVANALLIPLMAFPVSSGFRLAMTNRFLNRQLDVLARTPHVSVPDPARRHPAQLLEHLQALLQPRGWLLSEDQFILSAKELSEQDIPQQLSQPMASRHQPQLGTADARQNRLHSGPDSSQRPEPGRYTALSAAPACGIRPGRQEDGTPAGEYFRANSTGTHRHGTAQSHAAVYSPQL
ncbi:CHASE2 domain-containing protein [Marinobacter similis]|uniref:CHASE2 domain-containing protein n=1 Tax=Marinobacter similis TaxID=1420916 RepID=UPI000A6010D2|nr:CHASE2 domain-containing protein [Marinobacter similis]